MTPEPTKEEIIAGYFRHWSREREEDDFWAWVEVDELCFSRSEDPTSGLEMVLSLLAVAPSKDAIGYVAAGPLEDLLKYHGPAVIEKIKSEVPTNKRLLYALSGVWLDEQDEVYGEYDKVVQKYNLEEIDPMDNQPWSKTNLQPE